MVTHGILGTGVYFPKNTIEVKHLAQEFKLNFDQLLAEHGVVSLHVASNQETEKMMCIHAAKQALSNSGMEPTNIDLVICSKAMSKTKNPRPLSAQLIKELELGDAFGFDVDAGFIGGLLGIHTAHKMLSDNFRNVLIVGAQEFDELYLFNEQQSRIHNMIFGDGAGAIILGRDAPDNHIIGTSFRTDHYTAFIDHIMRQELAKHNLLANVQVKMFSKDQSKILEELSTRGVNNTLQSLRQCLHDAQLDLTDIDHIIKTQLSLREKTKLANALKVPEEYIFNASQTKGHLGHADILTNIHLALTNVTYKNMDIICVVGANYDCSVGNVIIRR